MNKRIIGFVLCIVISAVVGIGVFTMLNSVKNADVYDFGADQIASVKSVLGVRSVGNISSSTDGDVAVKSYEYKSNTGAQDVEQYAAHLVANEGFVLDGTVYVKASADAGKILKLEIATTDNGFRLAITKETGTLAP